MKSTPSVSTFVRVALLALSSFGVGMALCATAEAQPRHGGGVFVSPRGPMALRRHERPRFHRPVRPLPVIVQPVIVRPLPPPVIVQPAPPPPPSDAHGILVMGDTRLVVGQAVRAQWGAGWFDAQVIGLSGENVRIHYTGYGDMWNEEVPRYRLRLAR